MENKTCGECRYYVYNRHGGCCTFIGDAMCDDDLACDSFERPTFFDRITASPEVLAERLAYQRNCKMIHQNDKSTMEYWTYSWKSSVITGQSFETKEQAIAATVAKLKEISDE